MPSSRRGPSAWRVARWCAGANRKPKPTASMQRAMASGGSSMRTPSASSTSALPLALDTDRLPCLATRPPAAATTKAAAVDTLNRPAPSPPVPQVSTSRSGATSTFSANSRITCAAAAISVTVSPFTRSATSRPPICAGVASPSMMVRNAAPISAVSRSVPATARAMAAWMLKTGRPAWRESSSAARGRAGSGSTPDETARRPRPVPGGAGP